MAGLEECKRLKSILAFKNWKTRFDTKEGIDYPTRVASERSQSEKEKKVQSIFLPLMTLENESPKESCFWLLEDLPLDLCFLPDLLS